MGKTATVASLILSNPSSAERVKDAVFKSAMRGDGSEGSIANYGLTLVGDASIEGCNASVALSGSIRERSSASSDSTPRAWPADSHCGASGRSNAAVARCVRSGSRLEEARVARAEAALIEQHVLAPRVALEALEERLEEHRRV